MKNNKRQFYGFVGVDVHKHQHTAVVMDCWGDIFGTVTFESKVAVYPKIIKEIKAMIPDSLIPMFGLEDVGGNGRSLAVYLSDNDYIVKEVNPAYSSSERKNNPTTMKNDEWDAKCIGDVLARKLDELPDFVPNDLYWTIKQCVYRRDAYVKQQSITKIQLQEQLVKTYPSYKKMFSKVAGQTALAFWERYPSQHLVVKEEKDDLHKFLLKASDNHCSIKKVDKILELIESDGDTYRNHQETRDILVRTYVSSLRFLKQEIEQLEKVIETLINQLDYKLTTLTGCGTVIAAQLIAEIGDISRFKNAGKLARYGGIAPMKHSSAGKGIEKKARQGNRRLNTIFYFLALQQVQLVKGTKKPRNEILFEYYERKISEGKTKTQALICVQRRLVNIVYGMMKHKTAYDMSYSSLNKAS
ncbi:MAG: IS110 family transposase [Clostridia bacterium]|nr:IS110 family transposase [Clostridia bacterium]